MRIAFTKKNYRNIFKHPMMGVTFPVWFRILWVNKFAISLRFIPRAISITFISFLNAPLHIMEYMVYSRRIKNQKVKEPIFILGHPRSGTTHLHYLLTKDESKSFCTLYQALLPNSFLIGGNLLRKMIAKSIPETRPQDEVRISIDSPKEEEFAIASMCGVSYLMTFYFPNAAEEHFENSVLFKNEKRKRIWKRNFRFFIQKLSYANHGKQLILKSPANTGRVKEILEVFPDAKFIYIHRDSVEVYQSTVRLYEKVIQETSFQEVDMDDIESYILSSYRLLLGKYAREKELIPKGNLTELSYNNLLKSPLIELERVYNEIGLNGFTESKNNFEEELKRTKDYQKNTYQVLSVEQENELRRKLML